MRSTATALFVLVLSASAVAGDCSTCAPGKLCEEHVRLEADALKDAKPRLASTDAAERSAALDALAATNASHANAPSPAVTKLIVGALSDDSFAVRAKAAGLLASGQDGETALKGLIRASQDSIGLLAKAEGGGKKGAEAPDGLEPFVVAVIESLAGYRDDRAVDALSDFLKKIPYMQKFSHPATAAVTALAKLGSREGLKVPLEVIREYEGYGSGQAYHDVLVQFAKDKGLADDAPKWTGTGTSAAWTKWLQKHGKVVPAKLGKLAAAG